MQAGHATVFVFALHLTRSSTFRPVFSVLCLSPKCVYSVLMAWMEQFCNLVHVPCALCDIQCCLWLVLHIVCVCARARVRVRVCACLCVRLCAEGAVTKRQMVDGANG